jgi:hypothetical protein
MLTYLYLSLLALIYSLITKIECAAAILVRRVLGTSTKETSAVEPQAAVHKNPKNIKISLQNMNSLNQD